jgi:pimeloyl-ACP methyl ester carboxylesterase
MRRYLVHTSRGQVLFEGSSPSPRTILFHGFRRNPAHLHHWRRRLPSAAFGFLPGHGGAPDVDAVSVSAWAEAWREAFQTIGSPHTVIGESLGGLLAMCLPAQATVAVEPLLSTDSIWPQHETMRMARARGMEFTAAEEALFDKPYDWILDRISAPTMIIAGDVPLLPPRPLPTAPSLLTVADFERYAAHPKVTAARIPGGHALMDESPDEVERLIRQFTGGV